MKRNRTKKNFLEFEYECFEFGSGQFKIEQEKDELFLSAKQLMFKDEKNNYEINKRKIDISPDEFLKKLFAMRMGEWENLDFFGESKQKLGNVISSWSITIDFDSLKLDGKASLDYPFSWFSFLYMVGNWLPEAFFVEKDPILACEIMFERNYDNKNESIYVNSIDNSVSYDFLFGQMVIKDFKGTYTFFTDLNDVLSNMNKYKKESDDVVHTLILQVKIIRKNSEVIYKKENTNNFGIWGDMVFSLFSDLYDEFKEQSALTISLGLANMD